MNTSKVPTIECQSGIPNNNALNFIAFNDRNNQAQKKNIFADSSSSESLNESIEERICSRNLSDFDDDTIVSSHSVEGHQQASTEVPVLPKEIISKYQFKSELKMEDLKGFKPTDAFREYFENDFKPIHPLTLEHMLWLQRYG
jgi:hypothetical protein